MGWAGGGIATLGVIAGIEDQIFDYYSALEALRAGIKLDEMPEKPECLVLYDRCKLFGLPLQTGGLRDQPHIWLLEYEAVHTAVEKWKLIQYQQAQGNNSGGAT